MPLKIALIILTFFWAVPDAFAYAKTKSYTRKNGTLVQSHYRSNSDGRKSNNWSSKGNSNPFTGKRGYKKW